MDIQLTNRNAIITGGSRGLGKAMAKEFVRSGANVALIAQPQKTWPVLHRGIVQSAKGNWKPCQFGNAVVGGFKYWVPREVGVFYCLPKRQKPSFETRPVWTKSSNQ